MPTTTQPTTVVKPPRQPHLLIIDDDADIRELLKFIFTRLGNYRVSSADSAGEALTLLRGGESTSEEPGSDYCSGQPKSCVRFDLITLDWNLRDAASSDSHEEDGGAFLRRAALEGLWLPPVMVISAQAEEINLSAACQSHIIRAKLAKPFNFKQVLAEVRAVLKS